MGMQVSCCMDTEIQKEGNIRGIAQGVGRSIQGTGEAEREQDRRKEGHLLPDHMHVLMSIPPKYSVAQVVGYIKGKSAIHIARTYMNRRKNFIGENFWARGYYVSTVGKDEEAVRRYIQQQESEDRHIDQLKLFE